MVGDREGFKKVAVSCMGTRGDAQPFIAIALRLQDAGYDVTLLTNVDHARFAEKCGVKVRGVFMDFAHELRTRPGMVEAQATGDLAKSAAAMGEIFLEHADSTAKNWLEAVKEIQPDVAIVGLQCEILCVVLERYLKLPTLTVKLCTFPNDPLRMPLGLPSPPDGDNKAALRAFFTAGLKGYFAGLGPAFKKHYGFDLEELITVDELLDYHLTPPPVHRLLIGLDSIIGEHIHGGADRVAPRIKFIGFIGMTLKDQMGTVAGSGGQDTFGDAEDVSEIEAFLKAGSRPVYMGFGSMIAQSPEHMVVLLVSALRHAGARAIIYKGWAKMSMELLRESTKDDTLVKYAEENALFVGSTPHEWLFPQCECIVHHGGAGTTLTASKSKVPQVIVPVFTDQFDTSNFVDTFGSGVGISTTLCQVEAVTIGDAIKKVQGDESMRAKAKEWGEVIHQQDGATSVVTELEAWWAEEVATGNLAKYVDERLKAQKVTA